jgi:hypothetical protein
MIIYTKHGDTPASIAHDYLGYNDSSLMLLFHNHLVPSFPCKATDAKAST